MSTMLNQSLTLQPSSEGKHEYLEQKAFCIKIGKAKQLQEKTWPQDGTGCSSLEGNFTQAAPNSQRSAKETARQEKPSLPPARAQRDPKSISCSAPAPRGPSNLQPGVGKQRDGQQGSQGSRRTGSSRVCRRGRCQAREPRRELGMHQAAPSGVRPLRVVTYSFRAREFPVALARGIQIDIFTLTSLLTGVFTLRETG